MPKRTDIKSILLIGSGPIVIREACELDYSRTQACGTTLEESIESCVSTAGRQQYTEQPSIGPPGLG